MSPLARTPIGFENPGVALSHVVTETIRVDRATVGRVDPLPWRRSGRTFDPVMVEVKRSRTSHDPADAWHIEHAVVSGHLDGTLGAPVSRRFEAEGRHNWPMWLDEAVDYLTGSGDLR